MVEDNETATNTTMMMITGAGSAAAYGKMLTKQTRAAAERILIFVNCSADLCLAGSPSFLSFDL